MPIELKYQMPTQSDLEWLQENSKAIVISNSSKIQTDNAYERLGLKGVKKNIYIRESILKKLNFILTQLPEEYSFLIFDGFRTIETQYSLFEHIYNEQKRLHPEHSDEEIFQRTKRFVSHPDDANRYPVLLHNSGGAIDLTLCVNGTPLDMGTLFDEVSPLSQTNWFDQIQKESSHFSEKKWTEIQKNRRLLFNSMKLAGFVNYSPEWWHYDLGDCLWAQEFHLDWYYPSLENGYFQLE